MKTPSWPENHEGVRSSKWNPAGDDLPSTPVLAPYLGRVVDYVPEGTPAVSGAVKLYSRRITHPG